MKSRNNLLTNVLLILSSCLLNKTLHAEPAHPAWLDWSEADVRQLVRKMRNAYAGHEQDAINIEIHCDGSFSMSFAKSAHQLPLCRHNDCALCNPRFKTATIRSGGQSFTLVQSLSNKPLIINRKEVHLCWVHETEAQQVAFILAAQTTARYLESVHGLDISRCWIGFHCQREKWQSVGHTHLRLNGIDSGRIRSSEWWKNFPDELVI